MGEQESLKNDYQSYAQVLTDFLGKEVTKIVSKDKCIDIFKDFNTDNKDGFAKL